MKLLSATVKNYRILQERTVAFDPSRTLIGGPNETGKSTFIEAIHRGLFLKAKGTGALHKAMRSDRHSGHPEVEVQFETGDQRYTVLKQFSGQSGTTRLAEAGGSTWSDDEAEEILARLLGSEDPGGRATEKKINEQWAHLWVWQGSSGEDPARHASARQDDLLQRLQDRGGAAAMQSEQDARVAARFAQLREAIFTSGGSPRAGSDLAHARQEMESSESALQAAEERLRRLEQAMEDSEDAASTLARTASDLEELRLQQKQVLDKLHRAEKLVQAEKEQGEAVRRGRDTLKAMETEQEQMVALIRTVQSLRDALTPQTEKLRSLEKKTADLRRRTGTAEQTCREAQAATRTARLHRDLAATVVTLCEKQFQLKQLGERRDRVRGLEKEIEERGLQLSELPVVDRKEVDRLHAMDRDLGRARASLEAMSAEVEVVAADQEVRIRDQSLNPGDRKTLEDASDLYVGAGVHLRIHPGGGESLESARETVNQLETQLREALDERGLDSLSRASDVLVRREDLGRQIDERRAAARELAGEDAEAVFSAAEEEARAVEADVGRRMEALQVQSRPTELEQARTDHSAQEETLHAVEQEEAKCLAALEAEKRALAECEQELEALQGRMAEDRQALTGQEAQLQLLTERQGDEEKRRQDLDNVRADVSAHEKEWSASQDALKALQPDGLEADRDRLERALEETQRQREEAQTQKAVSQAALRSDGSEDPVAERARAEARHRSARAAWESASRKAAAIQLIDELFREEQQALADQFSQPLADRMTEYLQSVFGPGARAAVTFRDNEVQAIQLIRSEEAAMPFDQLSGGAREQVASAVRLAIAEVLAEDHEGTLPVVFDDAFAYADPDRTQQLQRMLDLAAARGLQIIVLTCTPSDYRAFGARNNEFQRESGFSLQDE